MDRIRTTGAAGLGLLVAALTLTACGSDNGTGGTSTLPVESEPVILDPAHFTTEIDNP